jgi:hypothetical protein
MMLWARRASVSAHVLLSVAVPSAALSAQGASSTIVGVVVAQESGERLAHSVIAVPALEIRRFADDSGTFALRELPAGSFVVSVRRLGYAPKDVMLAVREGAHDSLRIELTRVAVKLAPVQVRADPPCTTPGLHAVKDSALTTVLTQLRMNGEQYRLLAERYPFVYSQERIVSSELKSGETRIDTIDTLVVGSKPPWRYRPGRMLTRLSGRQRGGLFFNIPTLLDFADPLFLDNHCFADGGLDHVDGSDLIRIDLVAWARITTPDVNGSIFLDPRTFQIRRSVLRLSRNPKVSGLMEMEVTTVFQEALASIPIVSQVLGVQRFDPRGTRRDFVAAYEHHRLVGFRFVGTRPGDDP